MKTIAGKLLAATQVATAQLHAMVQAVSAQPYQGGALANGTLTLDLPATSVVVVSLE